VQQRSQPLLPVQLRRQLRQLQLQHLLQKMELLLGLQFLLITELFK
jgi:hypothetical protein